MGLEVSSFTSRVKVVKQRNNMCLGFPQLWIRRFERISPTSRRAGRFYLVSM